VTYAEAVRQRLVYHFGLSPAEAARSTGRLRDFQRRGIPADTAARIIHDRRMLQRNPLSSTQWAWLLALGSTAVGVALLAQYAQGTPQPIEVPPPPLPAGSASTESLGPVGITTLQT